MGKKLRTLSLLLAVALLVSLFSGTLLAAETEKKSLLGNDSVRKPSEGGALQVIEMNGQMTLADAKGRKIQLRGMSTHGLHWFGEIINNNAFATLAEDWESNVIRLSMYVGEKGYATDPSVKDLVYQGIDLAMENDMYVIVDWHVLAPGDPNDPVYAGAFEFFDELSDHYKDDPKYHYILWELCNEPSQNASGGQGLTNDADGWKKVKSYAEPIVEMLRSKGDNIIIVGSPNWSQRPDLAADDPIDATNIMYALHFYTGTHLSSPDSSDRNNVMANGRYALEKGVAVFATEWGTSEANGTGGPYLTKADIWLDFLNTNNISWCNWSLTNKNETSGCFTPYIMGVSEATLLDPGEDQFWTPEEMSVTGEFVRTRIKGIKYEPIDRSAEGSFNEVLWDFSDGTVQGFVINRDSPRKNVTLKNRGKALWLLNMAESTDITETNFWENVRISSEEYHPNFDVFGGDTVMMDVLLEEPTTVSIAAVPQTETNGWTNPRSAVRLVPEEFEKQSNGLYLAKAVLNTDQASNIEVIAVDEEDSIMTNIVLFIGTENGSDVGIDNIAVSGPGDTGIPPLDHEDKGDPKLPSNFNTMLRQGWDWNSDSGVKTSIRVEEANESLALTFAFEYPEIKPTDNWASAPRLELWIEPLIRGENDYLVFDFYLDPTKASVGSMAIHCAFQPPEFGYWAQIPESFNIDFTKLSETEKTPDGFYRYFVILDLNSIESIKDDTILRNMILVFADVESDFAGKVYLDNVRFITQAELDALTAPEVTATPVPTEQPPAPTEPEGEKEPGKKDTLIEGIIFVAAGILLLAGGLVYVLLKKKKAAVSATSEKNDAGSSKTDTDETNPIQGPDDNNSTES